LRAVIAGLGSIGRRHLANLRQLEPSADITVYRRPSTDRAVPPGATRVVHDAEAAWSGAPDCAFLTGPASIHLSHAHEAAAAGAHLFIEKPLANTADGIPSLLAECRAKGLTVLVAYNFRFYPPLQILRDAVQSGRIGRVVSVRAEVGQYLPDWRPGADYRQGVTAHAELGGGALLELSHELDYIRWIIGEVTAVGARVARLGNLEIDVEDVAEILLDFENGAIGSVHLDLLQRVPSRTCKIVGTDGTLTWDGLTNAVRLFSATSHAWTDLHPAVTIDRNEMYLAEMRHFLECVRGTALPLVTGDDGLRVVEIAEAARRASEERRMVTL
jgi:predicted dehydrogenase